MPKFVTAPPGTNPMEMPDLIKKKQLSTKVRLILVGVSILVLACMCAGTAYFVTKPKNALAKIPIDNPTSTLVTGTSSPGSDIVTMQPSGTTTPTPAILASPTGTITPTPTPAPTQTARVVNVVVTKIVNVNLPVAQTVVVIRTQIITQIITATLSPTQTPWYITTTPEFTQTPWIIIVEVTPTETATMEPTPTETPTETPPEPTIESSATLSIPYP